LLIGLLGSSSSKQQLDGAVALCKLANKASTLSPVDAPPLSPTPQVILLAYHQFSQFHCVEFNYKRMFSRVLFFLQLSFNDM